METFIAIFIIVLVMVVGGLLVLLRTAKKPHIPDSVKPRDYEDGDNGW